LVALASLFAVGLSASSVEAANVPLTYQVVAIGNASSTIAVDMTPLEAQADGGSVAYKRYTTYPGYTDATGSTGRCYPGSSGTGGYTDVAYFSISSSSQTSYTSGGYTDCSASGFYYINFTTYEPNNSYNDPAPGKDNFYVMYYWDAEAQNIAPAVTEFVPGFNSTTQTRFVDVDITGTSTVTFSVDFFLELTEIDTTQSATNPTAVNFRYSLRPTTVSSAIAETINNTIQGTSTVSADFDGFADGTYDLLVSFTNGGCALELSPCPFPQSYVYTSFEILGGVLTTVGGNEFYDGTTPPDETAYRDCSLTNIGNCISNAFVYLFFPSQSALNSFTILGDQLDTRFPFAYVFDFVELFETLFQTTQTESLDLTLAFASYGDITLISEEMLEEIPMSATIKSLLTYVLWLMFMLQMYNRTRNIFNSQTV